MYPDGFGIRPALREMAEELAGHDTAERALRDADATSSSSPPDPRSAPDPSQ
ncbi:hypothetical protein ACFVH4_24255 [Nocardia ignorata]|uniref:hypothetical protein n=1 Tax=Nocardia ignorata TaxID=145285 RepID=UPI0036272192